MKRREKQQGFTLIELVVVIAILGILAAFAIPRFIDLNRDARESSLKAMTGSLRSAAALVHGMALARGLTAAAGESVVIEGVNVELVYGYPAATAGGIGNALANVDGFTTTVGGTGITFVPKGAKDPANCGVTYTAATATGPATIAMTDPATLNCS